MNLQELKNKNPEELLKQADTLGIENPSSLRKQDLMFAILKTIAEEGTAITGIGVIEIMQDGFGFLRSSESNYLPGPDDIYVSPSQIKKFSLRTGDSVEGEIRSPKQGERYFAIIKIKQLSGKKHKIISGLTICKNGKKIWSCVVTTQVKIRKLNSIEINEYLLQAGKKILHSVGCYQVESLGPQIIEEIRGDFFNVMGLPLFKLLKYVSSNK